MEKRSEKSLKVKQLIHLSLMKKWDNGETAKYDLIYREINFYDLN